MAPGVSSLSTTDKTESCLPCRSRICRDPVGSGTAEIHSLSAACLTDFISLWCANIGAPSSFRKSPHLQTSGHLEALRFLGFSSGPDDLSLVVHYHLRPCNTHMQMQNCRWVLTEGWLMVRHQHYVSITNESALYNHSSVVLLFIPPTPLTFNLKLSSLLSYYHTTELHVQS